ncbi:hypothetical protein B0A65_09820 [Flavobacterium frigidimaris]|uniref:Uncharacterized protein n=1 Tax=Flavobacterium frigidimaris TaxID=262320 RepID=A0ABX4BR66_FLAFR|nr:hypothetical protein B0A65_09820 [Flavobacterium frigidimaris]
MIFCFFVCYYKSIPFILYSLFYFLYSLFYFLFSISYSLYSIFYFLYPILFILFLRKLFYCFHNYDNLLKSIYRTFQR